MFKLGRSGKKYFFIVCLVVVSAVLAWRAFAPGYSGGYNAVLITVDALRPDHLGCYGYERDTSPEIDTLAARGVLFRNAFAPSGWTLPSLGSLITSRYPCLHGAVKWESELNSALPNLLEVMASCGYKTAFLNGHEGLCRFMFPIARGSSSFYMGNENERISAERLRQEAERFIIRNKGKRFFLWIHFADAHIPYSPAPPYDKIFLDDPLYDRGKSEVLPADELSRLKEGFSIQGEVKHPFSHYLSLYDGAIRSIDYQCGRLFDFLKEQGLDGRTVIIISSDHGERIGEDGKYFSHDGPSYANSHIPMILRHPKISRTEGRADDLCGLIDVMPTLLSMLGLRTDTVMEGCDISGVLRGGRIDPKRVIIGEYIDDHWLRICVSAQNSEYRIIRFPASGNRMYDTINDPAQMHPLDMAAVSGYEDLSNALNEWIKTHMLKKLPDAAELSDKDKKRLRSLGYLQ